MFQNITKSVLIALLVIVVSAQISLIKRTEATNGTSSGGRKFSGGMIIAEPSEKVSEEKSTCESGGTCHGTCSNTWTETTSATCGKGTFTMNVYSPKGAETDYCIPSSARGNGKIVSGRLIINAHTQPVNTQVGTCTCVSGTYCNQVTVESVSVDLAQITLFGTN